MDFKKPLSFDEFQKASCESWKAQALKELKKDNIDSLQWKTSANIICQPYYDQSTKTNLKKFDHKINPVHEFNASARWWENRQVIPITDEKQTNAHILEALEGGADGIIVEAAGKKFDLDKVLKNVKLQYCSVTFITDDPAFGNFYLDFLNSGNRNPEVSGGLLWKNESSSYSFAKDVDIASLPKNFKCLGIGTGGSIEDQLVIVTNLLGSKSSKVKKTIAENIYLSISLGEDFFQNIASIKAARILLYQVYRAFEINIDPKNIFIEAQSSLYKDERYGPHENMLKSTTAAMAGIIGGCNALVVLPEDHENTLMRRMARNVSHILKEESYFDKTIDPAAGSYFIDCLTEQTAKHVWSGFQEKTRL